MKTPKQQALDRIIKGCEEMGRATAGITEVNQDGKTSTIKYEHELTLEDLLAVVKTNAMKRPLDGMVKKYQADVLFLVTGFNYKQSLDQNLDREEFSNYVLTVLK